MEDPLYNLPQSDGTAYRKCYETVERQALLFLETVAGKHRQAGILSEARVREGEFAEIEDRALRRFHAARVYTNSTQARLGLSFRGDSSVHLAYRIAQTFFSAKIARTYPVWVFA